MGKIWVREQKKSGRGREKGLKENGDAMIKGVDSRKQGILHGVDNRGEVREQVKREVGEKAQRLGGGD